VAEDCNHIYLEFAIHVVPAAFPETEEGEFKKDDYFLNIRFNIDGCVSVKCIVDLNDNNRTKGKFHAALFINKLFT